MRVDADAHSARLSFRNAINEGLPVVELAGGTDMIVKDDRIQIDFEKGVVIHKGKEYRFPALPKEVLAILNDGGFIPNVEKAVAQAK
jgi:3-isopropylmalate/(R)-2-methylmalate dehydratase small subunit